jgi:hypothetical protein
MDRMKLNLDQVTKLSVKKREKSWLVLIKWKGRGKFWKDKRWRKSWKFRDE